MNETIKLNEGLIESAKLYAVEQHRTLSEQIEHWVRLGKAVEDNPELPQQFILDVFNAKAEVENDQLTEFILS